MGLLLLLVLLLVRYERSSRLIRNLSNCEREVLVLVLLLLLVLVLVLVLLLFLLQTQPARLRSYAAGETAIREGANGSPGQDIHYNSMG